MVELGGELDVSTVPRLREQLADLIAQGHHHLVVDLPRIDFLDSTSLGVSVGGLKRVHPHDGSFQLVCTQERILKIFRITGMINVFFRPPRRTRPASNSDGPTAKRNTDQIQSHRRCAPVHAR